MTLCVGACLPGRSPVASTGLRTITPLDQPLGLHLVVRLVGVRSALCSYLISGWWPTGRRELTCRAFGSLRGLRGTGWPPGAQGARRSARLTASRALGRESWIGRAASATCRAWCVAGISAGPHGQGRPARRTRRAARGHAARSELARQVRQQHLRGVMQQPVARPEVDPARPRWSQPDHHAGAEVAAAPPINRVFEQQQVQHSTGPVPNRANPLQGTGTGPHGLPQSLTDKPMPGLIDSPTQVSHGHHLGPAEFRAWYRSVGRSPYRVSSTLLTIPLRLHALSRWGKRSALTTVILDSSVRCRHRSRCRTPGGYLDRDQRRRKQRNCRKTAACRPLDGE